MSDDLGPGSVIGPYRIDAFVGRGGMGIVFAAEHVTLGRRVALKVIAPELHADEGFRDRFLREARLAGSLDHPNIIPVYDAGEDGGVLYLAMRFVQGENLGAVLEREHELEPARALAILAKVGDALDEAHRGGLVHRDVKPDNILLGEGGGSVFLTDFGLVRRLDSKTRLTKTGYMMGTLSYMAPEVLRGEEVDARTDVYSLTCVLFECLTGDPPFARPSEPAVISSHLVDPPPSATASRPQLPTAIDAVISRGMAKDRTERYPTCGELIWAARAALEPGATAEAPAIPVPPTVVAGHLPAPIPPDVASASSAVGTAPAAPMPPPPVTPPGDAPEGPPRRRTPLIVGAAIAIVALAAILVLPKVLSGDETKEATGRTGSATGGATGATGSTSATGATGQLPAGVELVTTVEGTPTFIDVDAGAVWVTAGEGTLFRVDKGSGALTPIEVGVAPVRTTFTGDEFKGDAWVLNRGDGTVTRVPLPAGEAQPTTIPVGEEPVRAIAPAGTGAVWVVASGAGRLVRVDDKTGEASPIDVGDGPSAVAFTDGSLWVTNAISGSVSRVDPSALGVLAEIPVGSTPESLQPAGDFLWVANTGDGTVSVIDPASNTESAVVVVGAAPGGVTNDEAGGVWVQNREGDSVSRIDVATHEVQTFDVGAKPVSMTKTDGALWLATDAGRLIRIEPTTGEMTSVELPGVEPVSISADVGAVWMAGAGGEVLRVATDEVALSP